MYVCEGPRNRSDDRPLADLANALEQRPSSPAKQQEMLENTAIVVVWQNQVYQSEADRDILSLDGAKLTVNLHLVLQARKGWPLHALGNERVPIRR